MNLKDTIQMFYRTLKIHVGSGDDAHLPADKEHNGFMTKAQVTDLATIKANPATASQNGYMTKEQVTLLTNTNKDVSALKPLNVSYPSVACTGELPFIVQRRGYTTILSGQLTLATFKASYTGAVPVNYRPSQTIATSGTNKLGSFNVVITSAGVITLTPNYLVGTGALIDVNMTWFVS